MFSNVSEKSIRLIRWGLTIAWLLLIVSLFYDPISASLTAPDRLFAASNPDGCFQFQGECRPFSPYPMGARIFWGMVVPLSILILLIFGHEAWRRICPLSFISQLPRSLGWQRTGTISETSWLGRHALSLQWGLLLIGLILRLLLVNSDRQSLGIFLLLTLLSALSVGFLYPGKSWCNYFCPMAPVQMIYSEPRGLLGSPAHTAPPKTTTQSMCRTIDANGSEKAACVACKVGCIDIDAEANYWENLRQPDRKLLYYGYVGLVIGFYLYFWLYSGNWQFLSTGVWQDNQWATLMSPGFFIAGKAIAVPKLIAVPLTLTTAAGATYAIGLWVEQKAKRMNRRLGYPLSADQVQSRLFAIATFIAFNLLFFLGIRPTLGYFPVAIQQAFSWLAVVVSCFWLTQTWQRSAQRYHRERDASLLRRQLGKLNIDFYQTLEGRSLDDLNPDELYALARVLPDFSQDYRLQLYRGMLRDALQQRSITYASSLEVFQLLRQNLGLTEDTHWAVLDKLQREEPLLFETGRPRRSPPPPNPEPTVWRSPNQPSRSPHPASTEATVYKPLNSPADDATVYRPPHE